MSALKKLAGQTVIYGSSVILSRMINILFLPIFTGIFPREEYGIFTHLFAIVVFVNVVLTFGMETTFFRFLQDKKDPKHIFNQAFTWVLLISSTFALITGLLNAHIAEWLGYEGQGRMVLIVIGMVFLDALAALPLARLRHEEKVKWFSAILLANVLLNLTAVILLFTLLEPKIEYIFLAMLIASTGKLGMALWKNLPTSLRPQWSTLKDMIDYAFFIMLAGFAGAMNEALDRAMIPSRWSGEEPFLGGEVLTSLQMVGIYGAVYKVAILISLATMAFRYAVEPFYFKEAKSKNSPETFAKIFHYFTLAALAGFLILASFAQEIISFEFFGLPELFGLGKSTFVHKDYWSGVGVIPILLMAYVCSAAYIQISIWFKITKQTRFAILFTGTGALITILVNYFGIPIYGYYASAWATLLCYAVMTVMVYFVGQRYYPIPYRVGRMMIYVAIFVIAFFLNRQIGPTDGFFEAFLLKAVVCLLVFGVVYLGEKFMPVFGEKKE